MADAVDTSPATGRGGDSATGEEGSASAAGTTGGAVAVEAAGAMRGVLAQPPVPATMQAAMIPSVSLTAWPISPRSRGGQPGAIDALAKPGNRRSVKGRSAVDCDG